MSTSEKARYFESIVLDYLAANGYKPKRMAATGPQTLGRFLRKGRQYAVDCHAKAARDGFADTGVDYKEVREHIRLEKAAQVIVVLFFGDHKEGVAYCATLDELLNVHDNPNKCKPGQYPRKEGEILYFPRESMKVAFVFTAEQKERLAALTRRDDRQLSMQLE